MASRHHWTGTPLAVSMQLPSSAHQRVKEVGQSRGITNRERHLIYAQIGDDLDFTAEYIVQSAFLAMWAQEYPDEVRALVDQFLNLAPKR